MALVLCSDCGRVIARESLATRHAAATREASKAFGFPLCAGVSGCVQNVANKLGMEVPDLDAPTNYEHGDEG